MVVIRAGGEESDARAAFLFMIGGNSAYVQHGLQKNRRRLAAVGACVPWSRAREESAFHVGRGLLCYDAVNRFCGSIFVVVCRLLPCSL